MTDLRLIPRSERKLIARAMEKESKLYGLEPKQIQVPEHHKEKIQEAWRSRHFLIQVYSLPDDPTFGPMERVSVCRTQIDIDTGDWIDGISWQTLMWLKDQIGRGDCHAVEAFPAKENIVNVANMRHLWVFKKYKPSFFWGPQ